MSFQHHVLLSEETKTTGNQMQGSCPRTFLIVSNNSDLNHRNESTFGLSPKSYKDVELLLDSVNWKLFVYSCENVAQNNYSFPEFDFQFRICCEGTTGHFTDRLTPVLNSTKPPDCPSSQCNRQQICVFYNRWRPIFIFGSICIFGNLVVIIQKITGFRKPSNHGKEHQIYHLLVLNLAFSDMFTGVYLIAVSFEIKSKLEKDIYFSEAGVCNILGVINFVSSQVSLSAIAIISFFRYSSIVHPYKQQQCRVAVAFILASWIFWIIVGVIPIIEIEPFATAFTHEFRSESTFTSSNVIMTYEADLLIDTISKLSPQHSNIRFILSAVKNFETRDILLKSLDTLGLINLETQSWRYVGYYNSQYACSISYTVDRTEIMPLDYFTLGVVSHNLFACFIVFCAYSHVVASVFRKGNKNLIAALFNRCKTKQLASTRSRHESVKDNENQTMFCRITAIVLTDFISWLPLCVIFLLYWCDSEDEVHSKFALIYGRIQTLVLWMISLNSIINPYIYSIPLWKSLLQKLKTRISKLNLLKVQ